MSVRHRKDLGAADGSMLLLAHGAGDWSDPAVPDFTVMMLKDSPARGVVDLGAGKYKLSGRPGVGGVLSPAVASDIQVYDPHDLIALSVPYERLQSLMEGCLPDDGDFGHLHASEFDDPFAYLLLTRLWEEGEIDRPHGRLFAEGALTALAAGMLPLSSLERKVPFSRDG